MADVVAALDTSGQVMKRVSVCKWCPVVGAYPQENFCRCTEPCDEPHCPLREAGPGDRVFAHAVLQPVPVFRVQ